MPKESLEKLNRIANYIFLEICCTGENAELKNYLIDGLDLIEAVIDGEKSKSFQISI